MNPDEEYDEEGDVIFATSTGTPEDIRFDTIVGIVEELIVDDTFSRLREDFFKAHAHRFDDGVENPHHYLDIHRAYIADVEAFVERFIAARDADFSMSAFLVSLQSRKDEVTGDVWDLLATATDFLLFKETMLSYKAILGPAAQKPNIEVEGRSPSRRHPKPTFENKSPTKI